jgi:hypothetical protein
LLAELRRGLTAALLLLSFLPVALAGQVQQLDLGGVRCVGSYDGPSKLTKGYFEVGLELWNFGEAPALVSIEAQQQYGVADVVEKRVLLAPGERLAFRPTLRARKGGTNAYSILVSANGEEGRLSLGAGDWASGYERSWMYYSRERVAAGSVERWSESWSALGYEDFSIGTAAHDAMPTQWLGYSCFDTVVVRVEEGLPVPAAMDALLAWVRTGGSAVFTGRDPRKALEARRELSFLLPEYEARAEDRMLTTASEVGHSAHIHESAPAVAAASGYHLGHGLLFFVETGSEAGAEMEEEPESPSATRLALAGFVPNSWADSDGTMVTRADRVRRGLEGFGDLPLRGLMLLLVLFVIVMGPVNFIWVARRKRPLLLLISVPAVALVASIGLVLFGVFSQGLDVKVTSASYTFLDQVDRQATTAEVRRLFAGSSPGEGLRPEPGTGLFPSQSVSGQRLFFGQDLNEGRLLTGDYLPVRRPVVQTLVTDQPTRLRLEVEEGDSGAVVSNALGGGVTSLLLRDSGGDYYKLDAPLGAGERRELVPADRLSELDGWSAVLGMFWAEDPTRHPDLPPGSYLALADARELRDQCGITVHELSSSQYVFGVFEAEQGGAR